MIVREKYLSELRQWRDKNVIKVITGVRRCGKSTLMDQWAGELVDDGVPEGNVIHINLEMMENENLLEYHALHEAVLSRCEGNSMHYVLLDEVQNVPDFQKAIDSLQTRPNIDLYITGSNALLLGGTLATLLSGRYVEVRMLPFSFAEYSCAHSDGGASTTRLWSSYLHEGSFPAVTQLGGSDSLVFDYLDGILNTILVKDVAQRTNGSAPLLRRLAAYLYDNVGNLASPASIAKAMTAAGTKVSAPTVSRYLEALEAAFVIYPAHRFDTRGKRVLKQDSKYYAVDTGLRRMLCSNNVRDTGRLLENVIFLELLRREKSVYVGNGPCGEIDFVTNGPEGTKYWQVCESITSEKTLQRELSSFLGIRDNYPKTLITLDDTRPASYDGIECVYALDWLLHG